MGSYNMAFNKILFVLVAAGGSSAWAQSSLFGFSNNFNNAPAPATPSTTPVPILRYVDNQNIDGSYTYGYEAADGTYKLETRYQDGRVKGKYGYVDPDGILREASYGAEAGRGFEPQIAGLELPPPVVTQGEAEAVNEIVQQPQPQFQSFKPRRIKNREGEIKMINGRKALVKKVRKLKATPAPRRFIDESAQREASLRARQEGLRNLEEQRRQPTQTNQNRQQQSRSFSFTPRQETSRRGPELVSDPFVSNINLSSGSYSYSY